MRKIAILPTPGDPFVLRYWFDRYAVWRGEADYLAVVLNYPSWVSFEVASACTDIIASSRANMVAAVPMEGHGKAIDKGLQCSSAGDDDMVVLLEDDCPILMPGSIRNNFDTIMYRDIDLVGSPRTSCSPEIWDATRKMYAKAGHQSYDTENQPPEDRGPNWWPSMFFVRAKHLLATDRQFGARGWDDGKIPALELDAGKPLAGDTLVNTSIQLRWMGVRHQAICQFHSYPHDLELKAAGGHIWNNAPWVHIGSLSTLVGTAPDQWMFAEPKYFTAYLGRLAKTMVPSTRTELMRRYAWVKTIFDLTHSRVSLPSPTIRTYESNLNSCVKLLDLDCPTFQSMCKAYKGLLDK